MGMIRRYVAIVIGSQALLAGALAAPRGPATWSLVVLWAGAQAWVLVGLLVPRSRSLAAGLWKAAPQPRVAITFDDGPHPDDTPAILDILDRSGARATFFFIADRARRHPHLVESAVRRGHQVEAHSDTHPWWFSLAGPERIRREVRASVATLESLAGRRPRFFRPPMGHKNLFLERELAAAGMQLTTWSSRPFDTVRSDADGILRAVVSRAFPGGIILLHEGVRRRPGAPSETVAALAGIIEGLRAKGLEPVTLDGLRSGPWR